MRDEDDDNVTPEGDPAGDTPEGDPGDEGTEGDPRDEAHIPALSYVPPGATFRRAEGLRFFFAPCTGLADVRVIADRPDGGAQCVLDADEVRALCRLDRWQTADEAGVAFESLTQMVDADLAFWSSERPARDLTGSTLRALAGPLALRRNVSFTLLVADPTDEDAAPAELPFMPRRGELAGKTLAGFEFSVMEMEEPTYVVELACCAEHAMRTRELIARLDGRTDASDLTRDPGDRAVLEGLLAFGLLENHVPAREVPARDAPSTVTWLGHAAVLYESRGVRLLVDPLEYPCSVPSRHAVAPPDYREVGAVTAVLITHGDNDHLNPRTLCRVPRATPVFVPRATEEHAYQVDLEAQLALLGFTDVRSLATWERVVLGDVTVVAAPFRGEDWGLVLATQSFVIASPELTVYLNADSVSTPEAYERIAREFRVDLALVGVTDAQEAHVMPARYGYGHFYAQFIPAQKRNEWVRLCNGPSESAEVARALQARFAFGYAAGGGGAFAQVAYIDRGSHAQLAAVLGASGVRALALPLGEAVSVPAASEG